MSWQKLGQNAWKANEMLQKLSPNMEIWKEMWVSAFSENSVHGWIKNLTRDNKAARVKPVGCGIKNGEIKDLELGKNYAKARLMKSIDEINREDTVHVEFSYRVVWYRVVTRIDVGQIFSTINLCCYGNEI